MNTEQQDSEHRWFAAMYDILCGRTASGLLKPVHARIMGEAEGRVLEIGAGTGLGLSIYPTTSHVVATEPDPHMLKRANRRVEEQGLTNVELHRAPAEEIPFDDDSFDHVVTSLVLCTVSDPARSLAEAKRLLKPKGTLRFVEHVRNDESRFWGTVQDLITPGWRWFGAGCNPNRRTKQSIEDAGFDIEWLEQLRIGPGTPAIYGVAKPV